MVLIFMLFIANAGFAACNCSDPTGGMDKLADQTYQDMQFSEKVILDRVEVYLDQLANGKITIEQFKGYLDDIKDLTEMYRIYEGMKYSTETYITDIRDNR
jgi:hypothetical protein